MKTLRPEGHGHKKKHKYSQTGSQNCFIVLIWTKEYTDDFLKRFGVSKAANGIKPKNLLSERHFNHQDNKENEEGITVKF